MAILSHILNAYCLLVTALSIALSHSAISDQFRDARLFNRSKCCPIGSVLIAGSGNVTYACSTKLEYHQLKLPHEIIVPTQKISNFSKDSRCYPDLKCIEFLREKEDNYQLVQLTGNPSNKCVIDFVQDYKYFPKCCPVGYSYRKTSRKCEESEKIQEISRSELLIVHTGLSHCKPSIEAIVDHPEKSRFLIRSQDGSLEIPGRSDRILFGKYCIDDVENLRFCAPKTEICRKDNAYSKEYQCLWKCCPDGQVFFKNLTTNIASCKGGFHYGINASLIGIQNKVDTLFAIITKNLNDTRVSTHSETIAGFRIHPTGNSELDLGSEIRTYDSQTETYCIETEVRETPDQGAYEIKQLIYLYFDAESTGSFINIYEGVILMISSFFLVITIACYLLLPDLQNLHGKCIVFECVFLLSGSILLCYTKMHQPEAGHFCKFVGYATIFAFLGVFAWLNVICIDMWMTFGVIRIKVNQKKEEIKKFMTYIAYGFCIPSVITSIMLIMEKLLDDSTFLVPHIGTTNCYFDNSQDKYAHLIYFVAPMTLMIIVNVILFVKTAFYCIKVRNEIRRMQQDGANSKERKQKAKRIQTDKDKMLMLLKLFIVMGIPWMFEALTSIVSLRNGIFEWIEIGTNVMNCAKGIFIFCIFILKRKVWNSLLRRFGIHTNRKQSTELSSLTMTTHVQHSAG